MESVKKVFIFFILLGIILVGIAIFLFIKGRQGGMAALQITSIPQAAIFLDGKQIGKTPFRDNVSSGEHLVKIVAEENQGLFEQKLTFLPNILTVIDRNLDKSSSSGHTLSLFPLPDKNEVQITVISTPSRASVTLDSELKGITPLLVKDVTASDHELMVAKEEYQERVIRVKTAAGFKLVANVDLAVNLAPTPTSSPSAQLTPTATPTSKMASPSAQVRINQTPTGFLRVRFEPSLSASEVARVKPGELFPFLDEKGGWFKIKLPQGIEGWVSSQYSQKVLQ